MLGFVRVAVEVAAGDCKLASALEIGWVRALGKAKG